MKELEIFYNNKKISNNDFLKPNETQIQPDIKYTFNINNLYTLIMYDPDAVNGTHIHWLVININNNINNSTILLPYQGPAPPAKTGKHRYIFEIYKQQKPLNLKPFNKRSISVNLLKKELNITNYISKFQFISQNEAGGKKTQKIYIKRRYIKKTRKNNKK